MNRAMTSIIALGVGAYAYRMAQQNGMMSSRTMKNLRKKVTKMM